MLTHILGSSLLTVNEVEPNLHSWVDRGRVETLDANSYLDSSLSVTK